MPVSPLMLHIKRTQWPTVRVLCQNNILYTRRLLITSCLPRPSLQIYTVTEACVSFLCLSVKHIICTQNIEMKHNSVLSHAFNEAVPNSYICFLRTIESAKQTQSYWVSPCCTKCIASRVLVFASAALNHCRTHWCLFYLLRADTYRFFSYSKKKLSNSQIETCPCVAEPEPG
jgi:hypothetical protein